MEDLIVTVPRRWLHTLRNPREVFEAIINLFYQKDPQGAKQFEAAVAEINGQTQFGETLEFAMKIPTFVFYGARLVDPLIWKEEKNLRLFAQIYKRAKITKGNIQVGYEG